MTGFNDREDAFEKKFAHEQELDFKIAARACKLFALWAAEQLSLVGRDADLYAQEIVAINVHETGLENTLKRVHDDLVAKGIDISNHLLGRQLQKFLSESKHQVMNT